MFASSRLHYAGIALSGLLLACNLSAGLNPSEQTPSPSPPVPTEVVLPEPGTATPTSTETHIPDEQEVQRSPLRVAYISDGDVWLTGDDLSPQRITNLGDVVDLAINTSGDRIAYLIWDPQSSSTELRLAIPSEGQDEVLLSQDQLDQLYPLENALHRGPDRFAFIPGTDRLLLNSRKIFEGPGLVKSDDLLEMDTAVQPSLQQLLPPGQGGDFHLSPDGKHLAITRPTAVDLFQLEEVLRQANLITFPAVITHSEYQFYPLPQWKSDSSAFAVAIPNEDPVLNDPQGRLWRVEVPSGETTQLGQVEGDVFLMQGNAPLFSPDLSKVAFMTQNEGQRGLNIAEADGSNPMEVLQTQFEWLGWNPDSSSFVYVDFEDAGLWIGALGQQPRRLAEGHRIHWIDGERYFFVSGSAEGWSLQLAALGGSPEVLAEIEGTTIAFSVNQ